MNQQIQEAINAANKLGMLLEQLCIKEKEFNDRMLLELDKLAWDTYKITYDLESIDKYVIGGE